jgi:hypothetical protein
MSVFTFAFTATLTNETKCFVTVRHRAAEPTTSVSLVRSYETPPNAFQIPFRHDWTVKQALCASLAAALHFEPFQMRSGQSLFQFEDASFFGANNPAELAFMELETVPSLKEFDVGCLISLGSGKVPRTKSPAGDPDAQQRMQQFKDNLLVQAQGTQAAHGEMLRKLG